MSIHTLIDFARQGGRFVYCGNDLGFIGLLRSLADSLGINSASIKVRGDAKDLAEVLEEMAVTEGGIAVLIERFMEGKETSYAFKRIREKHPAARLILVADEVEPRRLILYHELGANDFVLKPSSPDELATKLARTIRPSGRVRRMILDAREKFDEGDFDGALGLVEQVQVISPRNAAAKLLEGDVHTARSEQEDACRAYKAAHLYAEKFIEPLRRLADYYARSGEQRDRLRYLTRMDMLCPINPDRKVAMGDAHLHLGDKEIARDFFDEALDLVASELSDWMAGVLSGIGDAYGDRDHAQSAGYYQRALETRGKRLGKDDLETFNRLGMMLRKIGHWEKAVQTYKSGLRIDRANERLLYNAAMAYAEGKDYARSRDYLLRTFEISPEFTAGDDARACYNIALVFTKMDDRQTAQRYLNRTLAIDPSFASAHKLRTYIDRLSASASS